MFRSLKGLLLFFPNQVFALLGLLLIVVGLPWSKVLMSIGTIMLMVNALLNLDLPDIWRRFWRQPALVALFSIFLLTLISGLWSENLDWLVNRLRMRLPFIALPFGILALRRFDRQYYYSLLYLFLLIISGICLYLTVWYGLHFEEMTEAYKQGKVIPTPIRHIRFALQIAFAVSIGGYLGTQGFYWFRSWERYLQLFLALFLIAFLHLLAVRSGLVVVYGVLLFALARWFVHGRRYLLGFFVAAGLALALFFAYQYVPTLRNKVNYTLYNLYAFREKKDIATLSDSYRFATIEAGLVLGSRNPWLGVGMGDLRDETTAYLRSHYPTLAQAGFTPQNQFVLFFAGTGLIGLLWFTAAILVPLFHKGGWRDPLNVSFHIIALGSFIIEQTLETQVGTGFYLVFIVMGIAYRNRLATARW